jgi:hypothetical protein
VLGVKGGYLSRQSRNLAFMTVILVQVVIIRLPPNVICYFDNLCA